MPESSDLPAGQPEEKRVDNRPCDDCGRAFDIVWSADNDLFNDVTETVGMGLFCPDCFDRRATATGRLLIWYVGFPTQQEMIEKLAQTASEATSLQERLVEAEKRAEIDRLSLEQLPRIQQAARDSERRVDELTQMVMALGWPHHAMSMEHPDLPEELRGPIRWVQELHDERDAAEKRADAAEAERDQAVAHLREAEERFDDPHSTRRFAEDVSRDHARLSRQLASLVEAAKPFANLVNGDSYGAITPHDCAELRAVLARSQLRDEGEG